MGCRLSHNSIFTEILKIALVFRVWRWDLVLSVGVYRWCLAVALVFSTGVGVYYGVGVYRWGAVCLIIQFLRRF